ncbi:MAG: ComF family protein [Calditrichia bacterium]
MNNRMVRTTSKFIRSLGTSVKDLFFPPLCLHCGTILQNTAAEHSLCDRCFGKLQPMPPEHGETEVLCRLDPCFIDRVLIAFQFNDVLQSVIHSVKYRRMPGLGFHLGSMAGKQLQKSLSALPERNFLPIPLHSIRRKEREFNQSSFISKGIISVVGGDLMEAVLKRNRYTRSQTRLNREERFSNVREAFLISTTEQLQGSSIIMVDDLITTGATMNECARILKENGVVQVTGLAVASPL